MLSTGPVCDAQLQLRLGFVESEWLLIESFRLLRRKLSTCRSDIIFQKGIPKN